MLHKREMWFNHNLGQGTKRNNCVKSENHLVYVLIILTLFLRLIPIGVNLGSTISKHFHFWQMYDILRTIPALRESNKLIGKVWRVNIVIFEGGLQWVESSIRNTWGNVANISWGNIIVQTVASHLKANYVFLFVNLGL